MCKRRKDFPQQRNISWVAKPRHDWFRSRYGLIDSSSTIGIMERQKDPNQSPLPDKLIRNSVSNSLIHRGVIFSGSNRPRHRRLRSGFYLLGTALPGVGLLSAASLNHEPGARG
ncbi:hypothetical protein RRG08_000185 [Elysia crispata]|uniref:Uncharacterized protein n=1 Tax=Elysia crispata TaxID=231223 RepID=A0AAE0YW90_9GAST|nr:hypothetical protein RRG08_000185 [Elysia crispata]